MIRAIDIIPDNRRIEEKICYYLNQIASYQIAHYNFEQYRIFVSEQIDILDDCPVTLYLKSKIPECRFMAIGIDEQHQGYNYILYFETEDEETKAVILPPHIKKYLKETDLFFHERIGGNLKVVLMLA